MSISGLTGFLNLALKAERLGRFAEARERGQWLHYRGLLRADAGDLNAAERFYFRAHQLYQECHHKQGCRSL